ncbi:hypothetical protein JTE90_001113 [Oedothorax gibbosus]|uniref:Uncharacterized protein n=1 Tax=Oedothorax gibbosus TaxID=931172 RepID=A0AAV6VIL0_9ARAC|nr:hypothetical protein JTE90_001113 [Oedothorax gibbosus]
MKVVLIFSLLAIVVFTEIFCDACSCKPPCPPYQYCSGKYIKRCWVYSGIGQLCNKDQILCAPGLKCLYDDRKSTCQKPKDP